MGKSNQTPNIHTASHQIITQTYLELGCPLGQNVGASVGDAVGDGVGKGEGG